jgi:hypothetical protein
MADEGGGGASPLVVAIVAVLSAAIAARGTVRRWPIKLTTASKPRWATT